MTDQPNPLMWRTTDAGDVPVSTRFDDPYYSLAGGLAETHHVFLEGNGLPDRLCPGFQVAELGFGTGLNFLAFWSMWESAGCPEGVTFTSFEAYPLERAALARAHQAFPQVADKGAQLQELWAAGDRQVHMAPGLTLDVVIGDARETVPTWDGAADAWFLDGFSPAKNPALWEPALMQAVHDHTTPGGTAATYSAAGAIRRALEDAGFDVARTDGFGRKRHMTRAQRP